jgi:hypothetical protein
VLRIASNLLLALALIAAAAAHGADPAPVPKSLRILFIGNSLTSRPEVPARVAALATAMGRKAVVESVTFDNYSLDDHWRDGAALAAIKKGWDVVVLQQGPSTQADSRALLIEYTKRFAGPIRAAGAKPALYMVWPTVDRARDFSATIGAYRAAAEAVDGIVIPAGEAWLRVLGEDKRARLYSDTLHPSSLGGDLAVLTIYLTLFPAGQYEFTEEFVAKAAKALEMPADKRDLFFDAVTRAIDEPMVVK